jgi:hypothetical protein
MTVAPVHDLSAFFSAEVDRASARCGLDASPAVRSYLAGVLAARATATRAAPRSIVLWLDQALAQHGALQQAELRALGEHALCTRGFFRAYAAPEDAVYIRVGAFAFDRAGALAERRDNGADAALLRELSQRFVPVSDMLTEVAVASSLGSVVRDLVALHDAWRQARSPSALEALSRAGLSPCSEEGDA